MDRVVYERMYELEKQHFWRVSRREMVLRLIARHKPQRPELRLLDVGGACSLIPLEMARFGKVMAVEPDEASVQFAKAELGVDAYVGGLPNLPVQGTFDVITLLDVLEHLDDDVGALESLRSSLARDGLLLITVPALPLLWSDHDVAVHHRRRYTRSTLEVALRKAKLEVEWLSYHTSLLLPVAAAQRLISRLKLRKAKAKAKAEYDVSVPARPINQAMLVVMRLEGELLKRFTMPLGLSLVAVVRHRAQVLPCADAR